MPETPCQDRNVVHVGKRLHSPEYGRPWYEVTDSDAMCYFGICSAASYNDWLDATGRYIEGQVRPQYNKLEKEATIAYGGSPGGLPDDLKNILNSVAKFLDDWDHFDLAEQQDKRVPTDRKTKYSPVSSFTATGITWGYRVKSVVRYFDEAACFVMEMNHIAAKRLERPDLMSKEERWESRLSQEGGSVLNRPDSQKGYNNKAEQTSSGGSGVKTALGLAGFVAIGGAIYFGFQVIRDRPLI